MNRLSRLVLLCSAVALLDGCSGSLLPSFASGESADEKPVIQTVKASSTISVAWRRDVDFRLPASNGGISDPAVAKSSAGERIVIGGQDHRARIFDRSGSELGRVALHGAGESGGLQLANGLVVVGDIDGGLSAIDINSSQISWRVQLPTPMQGRPVPIGNDFIVQSSSNQVFRFTQDGKKVWSYTGPSGGLAMQLFPSPAVYRSRIYVAMSNGDVVALKGESGGFLWSRQLLLNSDAAVLSELKVPVSTPLVIPAEQSGRHEDMLVVPVFQGELYFLSLLDGSTLMQRAISSKSTPLHLGKQLYIAAADGGLSLIDLATGESMWRVQLSKGELTGPLLWQERLWLADDQGMVYLVSLDGKLIASRELDGRIDRAPVALSDGVLLRNNYGTLYKLQ